MAISTWMVETGGESRVRVSDNTCGRSFDVLVLVAVLSLLLFIYRSGCSRISSSVLSLVLTLHDPSPQWTAPRRIPNPQTTFPPPSSAHTKSILNT